MTIISIQLSALQRFIMLMSYFYFYHTWEQARHCKYNISSIMVLNCQTSSPVKNWELTLLSLDNKNNKNNPHLISCRRGCPRVGKICVQTILSLIRMEDDLNFSKMEDGLIFSKMEDDHIFVKMKDNLNLFLQYQINSNQKHISLQSSLLIPHPPFLTLHPSTFSLTVEVGV